MEVYNYMIAGESIDENIAREAMNKEWCQKLLGDINVDKPHFNTLIKLAYIIDFGSDKKIKIAAKEISERWKLYYSQE